MLKKMEAFDVLDEDNIRYGKQPLNVIGIEFLIFLKWRYNYRFGGY